MPITIPDFQPDEPKRVEIPDFEPPELPPVQAATAAEAPPSTAVQSTPAPVVTQKIPAYVPPEVTEAIPAYSINGDKNPVESLWDAANLFGTSFKTALIGGLANTAGSLDRYVRDLPQPEFANNASPSMMALQGLNKMAKSFVGDEATKSVTDVMGPIAQEQQAQAQAALGPNPRMDREAIASVGSSLGMMTPALTLAPFGGTPAVLLRWGS